MRHLLTGLVVAATATMVPGLARADNQEVANQIAKTLQDSGQLSNYRIAVKYQDGTAWLKGRVQSQAQMNAALKLVLQTDGVNRVVNQLALSSPKTAANAPASRPATNPRQRPRAEVVETGAVESPRAGVTERIRRIFAKEDRQPNAGSSPQRSPRQSLGRAQRVPSSFIPAPARQAAVTEATMVPPEAIPVRVDGRYSGRPLPIAYVQAAPQQPGGPLPAYVAGTGGGVAPARYDQPHLPNYSWPSYAAYPNYAALTYPRQYSPTAWPFIGPFYPYPQVPLGWRKVVLEWDDGWWMLDFRGR